ncbi:MAG: nucleotidyl transferase AbiEii/AbiGii toxin family protein [Verrucomicrobiota bacterium]|nr:nucleotidyl transferase AbiEii/AbiGii toxin family protein [Verrucomicrobiota bacterium]
MEVRSVEAIVRALGDAKVRYLIVGGVAVNAHGFVRLTRDLDIVLALDPANAALGLRTLLGIGYQLSVPGGTPEDFANRDVRENWRHAKQMIVLKLWSDEHRRTPIDIFVYEPFDFSAESARASLFEVCPGVPAPVVSLPTLLEMKRTAGRPQDLIDITELQRMR